MDRDSRTRLVGAFISLVDQRDPGWMVRDLDADACLEAHLIVTELDGRLKKQYAQLGGTRIMGVPVSAPPVGGLP